MTNKNIIGIVKCLKKSVTLHFMVNYTTVQNIRRHLFSFAIGTVEC